VEQRYPGPIVLADILGKYYTVRRKPLSDYFSDTCGLALHSLPTLLDAGMEDQQSYQDTESYRVTGRSNHIIQERLRKRSIASTKAKGKAKVGDAEQASSGENSNSSKHHSRITREQREFKELHLYRRIHIEMAKVATASLDRTLHPLISHIPSIRAELPGSTQDQSGKSASYQFTYFRSKAWEQTQIFHNFLPVKGYGFRQRLCEEISFKPARPRMGFTTLTARLSKNYQFFQKRLCYTQLYQCTTTERISSLSHSTPPRTKSATATTVKMSEFIIPHSILSLENLQNRLLIGDYYTSTGDPKIFRP
jgi:hypothetical protein